MTRFETTRATDEGDEPVAASGTAFTAVAPWLAWLSGLLATLYLVGSAGFMVLLSAAFMNYSTPDFTWEKAWDVGLSALPLLVFAAVGFAGLRSWPRGPFKPWGLLAQLFQTGMAIWLLAKPERLIFLVPG